MPSPTDHSSTDAGIGVNLAIVYGFALIVVAFVLAIIYMTLCRDRGDEDAGGEGGAS